MRHSLLSHFPQEASLTTVIHHNRLVPRAQTLYKAMRRWRALYSFQYGMWQLAPPVPPAVHAENLCHIPRHKQPQVTAGIPLQTCTFPTQGVTGQGDPRVPPIN